MSRVAVVIPNWNGMQHLPTCLDALDAQTFRDFETIVVDNGSTDGSIDYLAARPRVRTVALGENLGFPEAVNAGIDASSSDYVVLLNNDTRAAPEWLAALVRAMDTRPEFSFASSKLVRFGEPERIDSVGHTYSLSLGSAIRLGDGDVASDYRDEAWIFGATAAASIYRRTLFEDVGPFDASFFFGHEDVEFDLRANVAGHRCLLVPGAVVEHKRGTTYEASMEIKLMDLRNRVWTAGADLPPLALVVLLAAKAGRVVAWVGRRLRPRSGAASPPSEAPWSSVSIGRAARTTAGALRALPAKRAERKAVRRLSSFELLRVMRATRTPRPLRTFDRSAAAG